MLGRNEFIQGFTELRGEQTFGNRCVPADGFDEHLVEMGEGVVDPLLGASKLISLHVLSVLGLASRVRRVHLFLAIPNFVEVDLVPLEAILQLTYVLAQAGELVLLPPLARLNALHAGRETSSLLNCRLSVFALPQQIPNQILRKFTLFGCL